MKQDLRKIGKYSLIVIGGVVLVGLIASALLQASFFDVLRVLGGAVMVLFLPGFCLTYALFPKGEIDALEKFALSVALSIATVPLVVFFANRFLNVEITFINSVGAILFICAVGVTVYFARRRGLL